MVKILDFSHNRNAAFKQSCDALRDVIDKFVGQKELDEWFAHFEESYSLPKDVVQQAMKQYLEQEYEYQKGRFSKKLFLKNFLGIFLRYFGLILYVILKSKKYGDSMHKYDLTIEWIASDVELERFTKLINLFGNQNVLVVSVVPLAKRDFAIIYQPKYKCYDRKIVVSKLINELKRLGFYLRLSLKLRINLIPIAFHIINQYLYYSTLFKYHQSKFCIQERHYQTSSIKNFLFHKYGGKFSTTIQKNIYGLGRNGFYYDIDVIFSLGKNTVDRAFEYGARINQVVPVGSMFMEHYWFNGRNKSKESIPQYDVIYLGINASMGFYFLDAYTSFLNDYYTTFKWLVAFSKENPHLKIGIKHHQSHIPDKTEISILKDTRIDRINGKLNSYQVAFGSRCAVTYGSTMGHELIVHNLPTLFLDPDGRSALLPMEDNNNHVLSIYRAQNYEEFSSKISKLLSGGNLTENKFDTDELCLNSDRVSKRIFDWLSNNENNDSKRN